MAVKEKINSIKPQKKLKKSLNLSKEVSFGDIKAHFDPKYADEQEIKAQEKLERQKKIKEIED